MYKYIDKYTVERAKPYIIVGDEVITNPPVEMLSERGYKPIEYSDTPLYDEDTEYIVPTYTDMGDKILCEYEKISFSSEAKNEL